jgi:serine palmitoyltransferase
MERTTTDPVWNDQFIYTGNKQTCLNLASYNYLGFAETAGDVHDRVIESLKQYGIGACSSRADVGHSPLYEVAEKMSAEYVGKEAAMLFGMGFATNSTTIPALAGKNDLIISDSLNHSSLVSGCRSSGAKIKVFQHNDPIDLERVVREAIVTGQPRTHLPWGKILIVVEGIYSMEGDICRLPELVAIKKKYGCYLYVDEAHSIGALGKTGRGICEHWGVDPKDVDILMGTFTKSFASVGGYVAADRVIIEHLKTRSFGQIYEPAMAPATVQQIVSALGVIMGKDGTDIGRRKVKQLKDNSNYFRHAMISKGFQVFGDPDSPIVPIMLYSPAKLTAFSRECLRRNLAVVVVGFPATPLLLGRARFCISASHSLEDLEWAVNELDEIGERVSVKYGTPESAIPVDRMKSRLASSGSD